MKRFPMVLWLLPIGFGIAGGVVASVIASVKYQASWWELLAVGCIVSFLGLIVYMVACSMALAFV